jgi:hypothetical protein
VQAGGVEESKFYLFSVVFPVRYISSISPRFYFRRHAFCFLPLAAILGFPPWSFSAGKKKKSQVDFQRGDPVAEPGVFGLLFSAAQCGAFA